MRASNKAFGIVEIVTLSSGLGLLAGAALIGTNCWSPDYNAACTNPGSSGFCGGTVGWCKPPPWKVDPNGIHAGRWEDVPFLCAQATHDPYGPNQLHSVPCEQVPPGNPIQTTCRSSGGYCCFVFGPITWTEAGTVRQPRMISACPQGGGGVGD